MPSLRHYITTIYPCYHLIPNLYHSRTTKEPRIRHCYRHHHQVITTTTNSSAKPSNHVYPLSFGPRHQASADIRQTRLLDCTVPFTFTSSLELPTTCPRTPTKSKGRPALAMRMKIKRVCDAVVRQSWVVQEIVNACRSRSRPESKVSESAASGGSSETSGHESERGLKAQSEDSTVCSLDGSTLAGVEGVCETTGHV